MSARKPVGLVMYMSFIILYTMDNAFVFLMTLLITAIAFVLFDILFRGDDNNNMRYG